MKKRFCFLSAIICLQITLISAPRKLVKKDPPNQNDIPQLFAPDIVTTADDEFGGTLSPNGREFFFCKKAPATGRSSFIVICYAENINGKWANVQVAPFSGKYRDFNPQFSPDGSRVYFMSNRPHPDDSTKTDADIWYVERSGSGWSKAKNMGPKINSPFTEYACSFANNGNMYISTARNGQTLDIYLSRFINGEFQEPQPLDSIVNVGGLELDACIAPDESYLLFTSVGREDMLVPKHGAIYPRSDIYISYHQNGQWSKPSRLAEPINSTEEDLSPAISRDGSTFFFTSKRSFVSIPMEKRLTYGDLEEKLHGILNGFGNIYTVSTSILEKK